MDDIDPTDKAHLYSQLRAAMLGRTNAKYQAAGLSMPEGELITSELNDAATFLTEVVYGKFITPLMEAIDADARIIEFMYEALGPAADEIIDMAQEDEDGE